MLLWPSPLPQHSLRVMLAFYLSLEFLGIIELKLSRINQVYYWILFSQTHVHYNYLWLIFIRNYLQKILKCQAAKLGFWEPYSLTIKGIERKVQKASWELLIKSWDCFVRANICNQSKSLHNTECQHYNTKSHPATKLDQLNRKCELTLGKKELIWTQNRKKEGVRFVFIAKIVSFPLEIIS